MQAFLRLAYCLAHLSNISHTPKQHLTPVDILLDSKLWAKVFKEMPAESVLWVKKNKGKSSTKFQLKDLCIIRITVEKVQKGFSRAIWHDGGRSIDYTIYRERGVEAVIESGILKCLVKEGLLPAYVLYNGVKLIEEKAESPSASLSSSEKGFVYLIRNADIYKIGITENVLRRMSELRPDEILNIIRCTNYPEVEKELHKSLRPSRIPQTEYFRLDDAQIEFVHSEMIRLAKF